MGLDIEYYGAQRGRFRAGSYGGYNQWRNRLAQLALGMTDAEVWAKEGVVAAFGELIHFSDCEGTLDCQTCKKLLKDFDDNAGVICKQLDMQDEEDRWWWDKYEEWHEAFKAAAKDGRVVFC
jgi:hypothetical protein